MARNPWDQAMEDYACRIAVKYTKDRPDVLITHQQAEDLARMTLRAIKADWAKLASLRASYQGHQSRPPQATGLFHSLTPEQQNKIKEYRGPENHGDSEFKLRSA